ncbi:hypothetical protein FALBO_15195 [Fusarium albosuccineum]|uniref:BZIP domain-containing protein n=1 Tax=Fusarium albosuccineum TaxID=1237068 RepID=A0A8H4P364_9HYPO|nr:hypothetical protein FALBO_15195 [Fusarium albosuccineum]
MADSHATRPGRPRFQDAEEAPIDEDSSKRLRMRLAQRAYRARKENVLNSERARGDKLSKALDDAMASFTRLHQGLLDSSRVGKLPDVLDHLNTAAAEMTAIANDTGKEIDLTHLSTSSLPPTSRSPQPSSHKKPAIEPERTGPNGTENGIMTACAVTESIACPNFDLVAIYIHTNDPGPSPVSQRIFQACMERVISLLSRNQGETTDLTIPMRLLGRQGLMFNVLHRLSRINLAVADCLYPLPFAASLPEMYRVVEGESRSGEWLEALYVEEYLEERGIFLRNSAPHHAILTREKLAQASNTTIRDDRPQQSIVETGSDCLTNPEPPRRPKEPADYSIFGLPPPDGWISEKGEILTSDSGVVSIEPSNRLFTDLGHQMTPDPVRSQITIDLDKLVLRIANSAMCLGPVPGIRQAAVDESIRQSIINP